jgi:hypothetical protein
VIPQGNEVNEAKIEAIKS